VIISLRQIFRGVLFVPNVVINIVRCSPPISIKIKSQAGDYSNSFLSRIPKTVKFSSQQSVINRQTETCSQENNKCGCVLGMYDGLL